MIRLSRHYAAPGGRSACAVKRIGFAGRLACALALLAGSFGLVNPALAQPAVSAVELVSRPATGQNNTYKSGDTARARVTFDAAVDVTGNPC